MKSSRTSTVPWKYFRLLGVLMQSSALHDSVIQDLGSLGLHSRVRDDSDVRNLLNCSIDKLRQITYNLTPIHLEEYGLVESIHELIAEYFKDDFPMVDFSALGYEGVAIRQDVKMVLFRLVQEGFNNIRKHEASAQNYPYNPRSAPVLD